MTNNFLCVYCPLTDCLGRNKDLEHTIWQVFFLFGGGRFPPNMRGINHWLTGVCAAARILNFQQGLESLDRNCPTHWAAS